jgi:23S rRNA pseudouridine1911/1915/1917 synthase
MRITRPLYEDNHLIIVNKPAGYLVQGDKTGDLPLNEIVKEYIRVTYKKPGAAYLGTVHRLDRPASGALIFAKTSKALSRMNKLFVDHDIEKKYWILTEEMAKEPEAKLTHYLVKDKNRNYTKAYTEQKKSTKKSVLNYTLKRSINGIQLYEIFLETGRPHQIRAQMAKIGCPVLGDVKYGAKKVLSDANIALHCRSLRFIHPVSKEEVFVKAALPNHQVWQNFQTIED